MAGLELNYQDITERLALLTPEQQDLLRRRRISDQAVTGHEFIALSLKMGMNSIIVIVGGNIKMMNVFPVKLTGQHVCLEPLNESHIPELTKAGSDRSIWPSIWPTNQYHPDVMEKYILNNIESHLSGKKYVLR